MTESPLPWESHRNPFVPPVQQEESAASESTPEPTPAPKRRGRAPQYTPEERAARSKKISTAQSKATARLRKAHADEYSKLYEEEKTRAFND